MGRLMGNTYIGARMAQDEGSGSGAGEYLVPCPRSSERLLGGRVKYFLVFLFLLIPILVLASTARSYHKTGTATSSNATVTFTFNPTSFCFANDESAGGTALWVDFTDGIAAAVDNSTNLKVPAATTICFSNAEPDPNATFTVGIITASSTAVYRMYGYRSR